jgi:hypothetical protein
MSNPNVLIIAQNEFPCRLTFKDDCMRLDGHPINLDNLMREVNRVRAARGDKQIVTHPSWDV